jgi:hypothetical protein
MSLELVRVNDSELADMMAETEATRDNLAAARQPWDAFSQALQAILFVERPCVLMQRRTDSTGHVQIAKVGKNSAKHDKPAYLDDGIVKDILI